MKGSSLAHASGYYIIGLVLHPLPRATMSLDHYRDKRTFDDSAEPQGSSIPSENQWRFVIQKHAATRLHYDLRLELNGVLLSWAIPKGPSLDTTEKRMAIHVEDHPLEYLHFEGVIPKGQYGGGTMMVWDSGYWTPREDAERDYAKGEFKFDLFGQKVTGGFMLIRVDRRGENQWLLIKERDAAVRSESEYNVLEALPDSVLTGRTMEEITHAYTTRSTDTREPQAFHFDPAEIPKAKQKAPPQSVRPCLPTATKLAPTGDKWIHEIKHDGYRMICHLDGSQATFQSRNGRDWTDRLRTLAAYVTQLPCSNAVLDGEVVMMNASGVTSFQALQNRIGAGRDSDLRYYVFDLLYVDGYDLTAAPLTDRKAILARLLEAHGSSNRIYYSEHMEGDGPTIFQQACKLGVEGIVSKRVEKRYAQGRVEFWLKTKCLQSREFLIGGYTPPTASRKGLGAVLLGAPTDEGGLHFIGKVGTGFTHETLVSLSEQLSVLRIKKSPFVNLDRRSADRGTIWVEPQLIAEIEFAGWTNDRVIRFGSFRGLRDDLQADDLEVWSGTEPASTDSPETTPAAMDVELPPDLATIKLTSPDRVVYPDVGITKLGLATYYAQIGKWMLPHIIGRPVSLLRCPGGVAEPCFFQKRAPQGLHKSVNRVMLPSREGPKSYLVIHDLVGLLALIQFGVLEFHISGARADRFDRPDRMVFDLDPDEALPWSHTVQAARDIRSWLTDAGFASFLKSTGGKGLHIVVPLRRRHDWQEVKGFSRSVAATLSGHWPKRFTTNPSKPARRGKILIDAMRNTRGATTVAVYSTRAKPHAPVSVPLQWEELDVLASSDSMSLQAVVGRLSQQPQDPWSDMDQVDQGITKVARDKLASPS